MYIYVCMYACVCQFVCLFISNCDGLIMLIVVLHINFNRHSSTHRDQDERYTKWLCMNEYIWIYTEYYMCISDGLRIRSCSKAASLFLSRGPCFSYISCWLSPEKIASLVFLFIWHTTYKHVGNSSKLAAIPSISLFIYHIFLLFWCQFYFEQ